MAASSVSQDSSVAGRGAASLYEVTMSIWVVAVGRRLLVVRQTHVVSQLVAETEVAKGTALLAD